MMQDSSEVTVLAVNFSDEIVEITFSENRNQSDRAALINQLLVQSADHREALYVILGELRDLIDEGLIILRDPPQKMNPRDRMRDAARVDEVTPIEDVENDNWFDDAVKEAEIAADSSEEDGSSYA